LAGSQEGVEKPDGSMNPRKIEDAASACLRRSAYQVFSGVSCECDEGVLFLRGRLSSFHHKQVAQEAVARVDGVIQVVNDIEVGAWSA
jgi:osmotically-inducible protein OsmY